jgi:hypothetical protein
MKADRQYDVLDKLLADYGLDRIDAASFWRQMEQHKFTQAHIDWFLKLHKSKLAK